jgi:hypothetical protein
MCIDVRRNAQHPLEHPHKCGHKQLRSVVYGGDDGVEPATSAVTEVLNCRLVFTNPVQVAVKPATRTMIPHAMIRSSPNPSMKDFF